MDFIHGPCGNLKSTQEINKKLLSSPPQDGGQEDQGHVSTRYTKIKGVVVSNRGGWEGGIGSILGLRCHDSFHPGRLQQFFLSVLVLFLLFLCAAIQPANVIVRQHSDSSDTLKAFSGADEGRGGCCGVWGDVL